MLVAVSTRMPPLCSGSHFDVQDIYRMNWSPWMMVPLAYATLVIGIIISWRLRERRWMRQEGQRGVREVEEWLREH